MTLTARPPGTWLRLVHTGLGAAAERHDAGWTHFLAALIAAADQQEAR